MTLWKGILLGSSNIVFILEHALTIAMIWGKRLETRGSL